MAFHGHIISRHITTCHNQQTDTTEKAKTSWSPAATTFGDAFRLF